MSTTTRTTAWGGRIFLSYRREDTAYPAGWLCDRLVEHYGGDQVFKDVDSIALGEDYVEAIASAVGSCDVLLALIGSRWLSAMDDEGRRRLDLPDDLVRIEIEAALGRHVKVIPVLVDGARMPEPEDLPGSLAALVRRQALELSPQRFDYDTSRLIRVLDGTVAELRAPAPERTAAQSPGATSARPGSSAGPTAATAERVRTVPRQRRNAEPVGSAGRSTYAAEPTRASELASRAGWLVVGLLLVAVLLLVLTRTTGGSALQLGRPHQPDVVGWYQLLWLLPAAPALRAAWIVLRDRRARFGPALGCIAAAAVWVAGSWAAMAANDAWNTPRLVNAALLLLLVGAGVALLLLDPTLRAGVAPNRWPRAVTALVILLAAVLLRLLSGGLSDILHANGDPVSFGVSVSSGAFWVNEAIPFAVVAGAALVTGNDGQTSAVRTFVALQVALDVLLFVAAGAVRLQSGQTPIGDALYVVGSLLLLWAARVGLSRRSA